VGNVCSKQQSSSGRKINILSYEHFGFVLSTSDKLFRQIKKVLRITVTLLMFMIYVMGGHFYCLLPALKHA
jgi:hypothetical protein